MTDPLSVAALSRTAPRVKFRPAQFHIVASQLPCVGRKLRPQQAWVHSVGNRGCIYWPFSGPSEPPCRTAAIDRSCTICAARGRSGSSVTADKPVCVKAAGRSGPRRYETAVAGGTAIRSKSCRTTLLPYAAAAITLAIAIVARSLRRGHAFAPREYPEGCTTT